jgi:uncharacterized protein involved in exopolysaccharide biosynthesis
MHAPSFESAECLSVVGMGGRMETVAGRYWDEGPGIAQSVWRYRWLVMIATLLGALAGFLWSSLQTPVYETGSRLVLATQPNDVLGQPSAPVPDPDRYLRNQAQIVVSPSVLALAAEQSGLNLSAQDLAARVVAEPSEGVDVITVSVHDVNPQTAARIADAVAKAYQVNLAEQVRGTVRRGIDQLEEDQTELRASLRRLESTIKSDGSDTVLVAERDAMAQELAAVAGRVHELRLRERLAEGGVQLIQPAPVPAQPSEPRPRRTAGVASLVALLLASGVAWWLSGRHTTTEGQEEHMARLEGVRTGDGTQGTDGRNASKGGAATGSRPLQEAISTPTAKLSRGRREESVRASKGSAARASEGAGDEPAVTTDTLTRGR